MRRQQFIIFGQPPEASQPGKRALHHPPTGNDFEAFLVIGALDDLDLDAQMVGDPVEKGTIIPTVRPDFGQARKPLGEVFEERLSPLAFPQVGSGDKDGQNQSVGIYEQMTFASFDLLVTVKADGVLPRRPPLSVVFTDWLSRTAAEGVGSRSWDVRTCSLSASWIWSHSPFLVHRRK